MIGAGIFGGIAVILFALWLYPGTHLVDVRLPARATRRAFLPMGLSSAVIAVIFGVMNGAYQPDSPLRQIETVRAQSFATQNYSYNATQTARWVAATAITYTPQPFQLTDTAVFDGATQAADALTATAAPPQPTAVATAAPR